MNENEVRLSLPVLTLPGHDEPLSPMHRLFIAESIARRKIEQLVRPDVLDTIDARVEDFFLRGSRR